MNDVKRSTGAPKDTHPWAAVKVISFGLAAVLVLPNAALADAPVTASVTTQPPATQLNAGDWRALSVASRRILRHTDQATAALADKKNDVALANIAKGLLLVQIIDKILPTSVVKTEITAGDLTYQDEDQVKPKFVPIYREYDEMDVIAPVAAEQQKKAVAGKAATGGTGPKEPEVTYAGFDYSGVNFNVRLANSDLHQAQDLINSGDAKGATMALQDILQSGVVFAFSSVDQPLVRAMDNLRLAESEIKNNRPVAAKAALDASTEALKQYASLAGESRAKEVQQVHKEIGEASKRLSEEKPETFSKEISDWWGKCRSWLKKY